MKAYRHSLGKVLDHKNEAYQKLQMELTLANEHVELIKAERRSRQQLYELHLKKSDHAEVVTLEEIRIAHAHSEYLRTMVHQQSKLEEHANSELQKTQSRWMDARREVHVLERHREREEQAFNQVQERHTQQLLDEMALNQFFRRRQTL
ncbi:MAG: hypothetical protein GT601_18830 [Acidaminobacter sp.]|uniref:flagellar export protein FliJ n=1 Tax=Acidaminobacter sp. TaxID=1872102 RepID=UPI00137E0AD6|nr:flagellar export protein FliJ [Acidaminobacter sp.]MZQ99725.1 hypothetical protein [Acidaminobacter sp.]